MTASKNEELYQWSQSSAGQRIYAREKLVVDKLLRRCLGYYLLHLGSWPVVERYTATPIKRQVVVTNEPRENILPRILASLSELPIQSDSVDAVYCPHSLEFIEQPHDLLRELERILVPEGYLILSCFNPWNLWNLAHRLPFWRSKLPQGNFLTCHRLTDWLQLLGFDIVEIQNVMPAPMMGDPDDRWYVRLLKSLWWKRWFSASGVFIIMAQKQRIVLTPVKYKWSLRSKIIAAGLAEPSTRS